MIHQSLVDNSAYITVGGTLSTVSAASINSFNEITKNNQPHPDEAKKALIKTAVGVGTLTSTTTLREATMTRHYSSAETYIESLSDQELASLESMLEEKINSDDKTNIKVEEKEINKTLTKKL